MLKTSGASVAGTLAALSAAEPDGAAFAGELIISAAGGDGGDGGVAKAFVMTFRRNGQCGLSSTAPARRSMAQVPQKLLLLHGPKV